MRESLVVRLGQDAAEPVGFAIRSGEGRLLDSAAAVPLSEVAAQGIGRRIQVLVPSTDILLAEARVPSRHRQRVLKAVPFALEEQLTDEVDALHFALGERQDDDAWPVAVVARSRMDAWLAQLRAVDLVPESMVPDVLALPWTEGRWTLLVDGQQAWLRHAAHGGFACELAMLPVLFQALVDQNESRTPLEVLNCGAGEVAGLLELDTEIEHRPCPDGTIGTMARQLGQSPLIDLLQGAYSRRQALGRLWRPWRATAALLGLVVALGLADAMLEIRQLAAEQQQLRQRIEALYRQAFPDAKRVVNARAQMEQRLKALRGSARAGGSDFLHLLAGAGQALQGMPAVHLRALAYRQGRLDLELTAASVQAIDQLKQALARQGGLKVEIQSATASGGRVQGRLRIEAAS